ncbi:hypothetical protein ACLQ2N_02235 [Streptomyces sp. DT224]|uniref:hypothetical protein n=1 Tax=unclassified Streptomyces TaxID=2593676 RepID=UPI0011CEA3DE|nr:MULTISPECIES: hypothetical protein [unclassified Streptomyces]TXS38209.1 hypothetical protein EAO72_33930 [Streptomyces sp. or43]WRZ03626.1 hypothetical protein OG959_09860 [Streptomyces sp. NBC_00385]
MNPYDPAERPGAHLVAEKLGVDDPWLLTENHAPGDARDLVGQMIAEDARNLDSLQGQLVRAARSAVELLEPICRGEIVPANRYGVLESVAPRVEVLAASRAAAHEQLTRSIATFRRLTHDQSTARAPKTATQDRGMEQEPARHDDWAISGDRPLVTLEAVEAGGLRFHQSAVSGDTYLSDGQGQRPDPEVWPETVRRMVADGLLDQDTSVGMHWPGQPLSLTQQGKSALQAARAARPRVSAALSRSNAPAHGTTADPAAGPVDTAIDKPSRSR